MQRDFLEPGGFGETLGNDVSPLRAAVAPCRRCWMPRAHGGMLVIHTREGHRPDLADCPPAKIERGEPKMRIGDARPDGPDPRSAAKPGHDIIPELYPRRRRAGDRQAGQGRVLRDRPRADAAQPRHQTLIVCGVTTEVCVNTTVREANDRGYRMRRAVGLLRLLFPRVPRRRPGNDQGAGRHLRLGVRIRSRCSRRSHLPRKALNSGLHFNLAAVHCCGTGPRS